ncbi:Protein-tyrosine phosphatase, active site [Kalmanozyma brasiliensis GHG001]|uniref:phosphatidylinositol-3,4,5-trisphosphate 3-phosphatase n=1 Tax=Kalmanozyma brasiliensis (strain GHG001) TaxID=1365824 RepID=V5EYU7_KALBG|nr:Protein-tyrosine phosphatase, active site [Kalmanozyma brasiliensis GHG001]EST07994.1 Protein-tyrosine phosphatase, active site [Kalmanozyma brasiliensis GHG001]
MTSIARRIVSGQKARFQDPVLDLDLDLTYVTDHLIIMGFPASGVASLYRNKRSDVRRFLDKRHDDLYRVYNFCPVTENSYDADEFYGRVSRYPFPDHHVPPLSLIPLFVADITEYLESDPDATAVIHCKAGKGRSGTMTCCYLVSLPYLPTPPTSLKNYSKMKRPPAQATSATPPLATIASADGRPNDTQASASTQTQGHLLPPSNSLQIPSSAHSAISSADSSFDQPPVNGTLRRRPSLTPDQSIIRNDDHNPENEMAQISSRLQTIFDLHTSRRMKPQSTKQASRQPTGLAPSARSTPASSSSTSLHALGAGPAGRSCDAFSSTGLSRATSASSSSVALNANTEDHSDTRRPKMGVSIPSQRRWVGYWTRMLAGRDARLSMTSVQRQPRRQIRIVRISIDRRGSSSAGKTQGWVEGLVPHSDSLSVQLVRYDDALVDRLEGWERHARRRAKAFGKHDPSGLAGDLDVEEQKQRAHLKTLRRQASQTQCWDGRKFGGEHEGKIGNWGVCVKAEAERARTFEWHDDGRQLNHFALWSESRARTANENGWRYTFEPPPSERKQSADSGYHSQQSDDTTPPSSTSYLPQGVDVGDVLDADREVCVKVLVGRTGSKHAKLPDIASAGWCWFIPSFEDPLADGGVKVGSRTVVRFGKDEIDFRKEPLGLVGVEVEWEWVSVGVEE